MKNHLFLALLCCLSLLFHTQLHAKSFTGLAGSGNCSVATHGKPAGVSNAHLLTCPDASACVTIGILYVDADAVGANNGTSWANAYLKLQDAIAAACAGEDSAQIWVASGTYYPDEGAGQTNNLRTSSFQLCNNVALYGGFTGIETLLSQRNWVSNVTTLSGDIDQVATVTNNAYHVLIGSGTNNTAILDGFTVTGGNANGGAANNNGGGMVNLSGSPLLRNLRFTANNAATLGGAIHNSQSSPVILNSTFISNTSPVVGGAINAEVNSHMTVIDCDFISNVGTINGGAVSISQSNPIFRDCRFIGNSSQEGGGIYAFRMVSTLTNCLFSGNRATNRGAGLHLTTDSNSKLLNCTISGNNATGNGGGILLWNTPNLTLVNTIIYNNRAVNSNISQSASIFRDNATANFSYCLVGNSGGSGAWNPLIGNDGGNNIDINPLFVFPVDPATAPTTAGDLKLTSFSLAKNVGSNAAYDVVGDPQNDLDLANNPRVFDYTNSGIIDLGPYEFQGPGGCPSGPVLYVKSNATGNNDGTSWANAFSKLQDALSTACTCSGVTQVWVASGTYYPDEGSTQTNNLRTSSFSLCNNKAVYGGFNGTETSLSQRNFVTNVTTLSGDIDQVASATNNAYHVLIGSGTNNTAILDGFTVSGGNANGGGANNNGGGMVNLSGSPMLSNMRFTANNATTLGGAIHNSQSSPVILNSTFITNTSALVGGAINAEVSSHITLIDCDFISNLGTVNGGAIAVSQSNPIVRDCRFIGNSSQEGGGIYAFRMVSTFTNCLFSGNRATNRGAGLHLTTDSNSKLLNCTITGNSATGNGGGILLWNTPNLSVINTIIHNNRAAGSTTSTSASIFRDVATANFSYSLVANSGGSGSWNSAIGNNNGNNIDANPAFVTPVDPAAAPTATGDLRLTSFSPAMNVGSNAAYDVVGDPQNDLDLANNPRVFDYNAGGIIDMGPYEFQGQSACPGGSILYVNASAAGSNNGTSWTNAFTKLQDAIAAACGCGINQVWVAAGTYYPDEGIGQANNNRNSSFQMCSNVQIYGGFDGTEALLAERDWNANETILSGNIDGLASTTGNAYHVVLASNTNNSALLDGFTIREGNANGAVPLNRGGGVYKENGAAKFQNIYFNLNLAGDGASYYSLSGSSTLTDCVFQNNHGSVVVGGVINQGSPAVITRCHFIGNSGGIETAAIGNTGANVTIRDCSFIGNTAGVGNGNAGAIHSWGSTVNIYNCLFSGNRATRNGGAVFNTGSTTANIVNCTFSGNWTTLDGGAIYNEQNAISNVRNSIIWNNRAGSSTTSTSASVFNNTSTTNVYYSLVANSGGSGAGWQSAIGVDGGNNIAIDPLFVTNVDPATAPTTAGDLHLQPASPAINSGNNAFNPLLVDLDGNPRIADDVIDMGPYELPCTSSVWYADADGDGFGDPDSFISTCDESPEGYVLNDDDCDDSSDTANPDATESCDGEDNNCNGQVDEGVLITFYADVDNDGYGDADTDTLACEAPTGYVSDATDCNDSDAQIHPGQTETCDGEDNNCNDQVDEGVLITFYADTDNDGYGDAGADTLACEATSGYVTDATDCNDSDALIYPGQTEVCDGVDNDCDGFTDDADPDVVDQVTWYADTDSDGYGDPEMATTSCFQPEGYVSNNEDCDDANEDIHPGAEVCNGIDDDCDGIVDDGLSCEVDDGDGDGVPDEEDNCPAEENPGQADSDCDTVGDACDVCPGGDDTIDENQDGQPDCFYLPEYEDLPEEWICAPNKIAVSHIGQNGECTTLCLNYNAAQAHLNHGDYLGPCNAIECPPAMIQVEEKLNEKAGSELQGHEHDMEELHADGDIHSPGNSEILIYPNPSEGQFHIHLDESVETPATLRVYNELTKLCSQITITQSHFVLNLGDAYPAGCYWLAFHTTDEVKYMKVVKL